MSLVDYVVLFAYLGLTCGITALFAGRQKSLRDYFMGDRGIPWYAAACSGVATIASAASFIGGPGVAFSGNLQFLQYRLAMPLVLGVICGIILPMFFRLHVYSIYEYLERRFDSRVRLVASLLFLLLKAAYLAIVIYTIAILFAIFVQTKAVERVIELSSGGPPPGAAAAMAMGAGGTGAVGEVGAPARPSGPPPHLVAAINRVKMGGIFLSIMIVTIVLLMVVKPSF